MLTVVDVRKQHVNGEKMKKWSNMAGTGQRRCSPGTGESAALASSGRKKAISSLGGAGV